MSRKSPFARLTIRIMGEKSGNLDLVRGRLVLLATLFVVFYAGVMVRLVDVTLIQGLIDDSDSYIGAPQADNEEEQSKFRADIVDRNGVLLATSLKTASLHADPKIIVDPVETAKGLSKIFPDVSYGETLKKLQSDKRFVWIKRNLTPDEQKKILELGDPGLVFDYDYQRFYPQGALTAHMVGYDNIDGKGLAGIERSFDHLLRQSKDPMKLTLDVRLQHILRREIKKAISDFTAKAGAGVIMDVNTGEILAATSLPDFNPHAPSADPKDPEMFNRVTLGVYELGSTFKIFTTAALLEQKKTPFTKKYDTSEPVKIAGYTIHDFHGEKRPLTIPEVFMVSSNIGTVHMAQEIGTDGLKRFYTDLGLMKKPEFEIDEVGSPIIPSPWREVNTLTASYGHGIAVTPLQLVTATSTIVNGGLKVTPHLVKQDEDPISRTRIVSKETSLKMRQLMRLVVSSGTARKADVEGYMIGGKTGTAEKNIHGRYSRDQRVATFVGAFPIDDPKYAILVMVDEPHPNKSSYGYATAGWVAVPAVGRIVSAAGSLLGMKPETDMVDISEPLKQFVSAKIGEH
ncbi:MAG TPA: penicillin-binding protein 2 [Alphaproteobacteria bacterium]|nr:penicillin-binding protein 2 [Alphaproteobacteria bacterium]HNS45323.1 penicillin-binding protein 2 [Alphaproteobacteria bacterium]